MRTSPELKYSWSVDTGRRLDILNVLAQGVCMDGPIVQADSSFLIDPGEGVLHPVLVIPFGEIFAGVSAAALGAGDGRFHQRRRLKKKILDRKSTRLNSSHL